MCIIFLALSSLVSRIVHKINVPMGKCYLHGLLILVSGALLLNGCSKSSFSPNLSTESSLQYANGMYVLESGNSRVLPQSAPSAVSVARVEVATEDGQLLPDEHAVVNSDGSIDLQGSMQAGLFGSNPQSGASRLITVYYRVIQSGQEFLQKAAVIARYYDSPSEVPSGIEEDVTGAKPAVKSAAPAAPSIKPPQIIVINKGH